MKNANIFLILLVFTMLFSACPTTQPVDPQLGTVELNFQLKVNGGDAGLRNVYQVAGNRFLRLDSLRFYVSDVRAVKEDGSELAIKDAILFDFDQAARLTHGTGIFYAMELPTGKYKGLRFRLGLPTNLNHADANSYDIGHPLNRARGMYWNTSDGYVFLQIAGASDSVLTGSYATPVSYQIGLDNLLTNKDYTTIQDHEFTIRAKEETQFIIQTELSEILQGVDVVRNPITHSRPQGSAAYQLAQKIMENFGIRSLYKVP